LGIPPLEFGEADAQEAKSTSLFTEFGQSKSTIAVRVPQGRAWVPWRLAVETEPSYYDLNMIGLYKTKPGVAFAASLPERMREQLVNQSSLNTLILRTTRLELLVKPEMLKQVTSTRN
jgi:hypothetical protein